MSKITPPSATGLRQLIALAQAGGSTWAADGLLPLPPALGTGSVQCLTLESGLTLALFCGTLHQALELPHLADLAAPTTWLLTCTLARGQSQAALAKHSLFHFASSAQSFVAILPADILLVAVEVSVTEKLLLSWLQPVGGPPPTVLTTPQLAVKPVVLSPPMQVVLAQLAEQPAGKHHLAFFHNIKARELLCLLVRDPAPMLAVPLHLHVADVEKALRARTLLLASLASVPQLPQLAATVGLRVPVLQALFRQLFGSSLYQYFQEARMQEAQRLLQYLSVSETGFQLGFSNLSHFARLFQKRYQVTPKKYQSIYANSKLHLGLINTG